MQQGQTILLPLFRADINKIFDNKTILGVERTQAELARQLMDNFAFDGDMNSIVITPERTFLTRA